MGNEIKIVIGGDASSLVQANNQANASVDALQKTITSASTKIDTATSAIRHSFDDVAAGKAAMDKISASIDAAADAATKAGPKFDSLGGRFPLADVNAFRASIQTLKNDLKGGFSPQIEAGFNKISQGAGVAQASLSRLKPGANQAGAALTNLGRVAQDLPFGFVGIQNNLNPLLESFQRLKAETGSSKEALKALGGSLIGAGGIGLALSVVSAGILIFQNGIAGFNSKTKEAKDKADELAKSIRSIGLIQGEATAGVEGQISQVAALAQVVSDSNKPYAQRKRALEELKDINKSYFGDLKLEDAATGALTKTVDEYTKALINNAIQKGFVDEIAAVAKAVAKQDDIIAKSKLKLAQAQREAINVENSRPSGVRDVETAQQKRREAAGRKEAEALAEVRAEGEKVTELLLQEAVIRDQLNKAVSEGLKFKDLDTKGDKKEEDILKKRLEALEKIKTATKDATQLVGIQEAIFELQVKIAIRDQGKNQLSNAEVQQQIIGFQDELNEAFKKQAVELEAIPKIKISPTSKLNISDIINRSFASKDLIKLTPGIKIEVTKTSVDVTDLQDKISKAAGFDKKIPIPTQFEINAKLFGIKFAQSEEDKRRITQQLQDNINGIITSVQVDGFAAIGESIGNAITGGGDILSGLFQVLATGLQQLGKALIGYGVALLGFKAALKSLNPVVAIAAGVAAIAAGAALKASVPKFAEGGIASRATLGIFGEAGKEAIIPLDRLPELLGRINVNNQNDVALAPTFRVSLTDLELGLERVRSKRRRLG